MALKNKDTDSMNNEKLLADEKARYASAKAATRSNPKTSMQTKTADGRATGLKRRS